jgi:predicted nucleotidyltransferase
MELAAILRKTSGLADVVAESLAPLSNDIDVAFIFGSVARGAETAGSDVDLLIVGATSFGAVVEVLHPVQQQLSREINPKVFTAREWSAKRKQKNPFVLEVLGKPKIFLLGTENDLTELGRYKP